MNKILDNAGIESGQNAWVVADDAGQKRGVPLMLITQYVDRCPQHASSHLHLWLEVCLKVVHKLEACGWVQASHELASQLARRDNTQAQENNGHA